MIVSTNKKKTFVTLSFSLFFLLSFSFVNASNVGLIENQTWQQNLTGIFHSAIVFGDIDNDGDLDLITSGCSAGGTETCTTVDKTRVYINNGTSLVENSVWEQNLTGVGWSSLAFGDIDNDGDLDLVLSGSNDGTNGFDIKIYINNGTTLIENSTWQQNLTGVNAFAGAIAFGDIDNDGDLDLSLIGADSTTKNGIYINNGSSFIRSSTWLESLPLVGYGVDDGSHLAFGDIDNDNDLDLLIVGSHGTSWARGVYINNGTSLVENTGWETNFPNIFGESQHSIVFGNWNNDAYLDFASIGLRAGDHFYIFHNNGTNFVVNETEATNGSCCLSGYYDGSLAWGDYDNDGDLDIVAIGMEAGRARVYENGGSNPYGVVFYEDTNAHSNISNNIVQGSLAWGDIDNDNDLDLVITGKDGDNYIAKVYINNNTLTNTKPSPPNSSFSLTYINNILTLSWGNGSDNETPTNGLYYNLMVGNSTRNHTIVSGVYGGEDSNGYFGNMMQRKNITLNVQLEANKTYYWYVQTIDTGLAKSNWSAVQTFNTSLDVTKPNITIQEPSPNSSLHTTNPYFTFNATVTDANLTNVTLHANWTGNWHINQSNSSGINGTYIFNANLTNNNDGYYAWYIGANDSSNNSETSATRDFYLDRGYPIIRLISPANASTWTSSSTVTFSYNVTDVDIANCSLVINNAIDQTDTTITEDTSQTFTKSLSNAAYTWQVNCTDYVGYINNSETRSLTVSYTAPSSGNGGGGGGGGTTTITVQPKKFDIDFSTITIGSFEAKQGDVKTFSFNSQITHKITTSEITENSIKLIIESEPIILILSIGETKQIDINKDNINDFEIKLISITNGKAKFSLTKLEGAEIVAREEIEEMTRKEALFDVKIIILDKFKEVFPGEEVSAKIEVFNVNNIGQVDVIVDYYLSDSKTILASASDVLAVEAVASFVRSLIVPEDVEPGTYFFNVNVTYKDFTTSSKTEFKVKSKAISFIQKRFKEIIIIIVIFGVIILIVYLTIIKRKEERLEKKEKRLEKEIKKFEKGDWKIWRRMKK